MLIDFLMLLGAGILCAYQMTPFLWMMELP